MSLSDFASVGVSSPLAVALMIAARAGATSASTISGRSRVTTLSRRVGIIRSRQSRKATVSPAFAISIALRVSFSPSPSSSACAAIVVLFRAPFGRPAGLPDTPRRKRFCCFSVLAEVMDLVRALGAANISRTAHWRVPEKRRVKSLRKRSGRGHLVDPSRLKRKRCSSPVDIAHPFRGEPARGRASRVGTHT